MAVNKVPADEAIQAAFERYTSALGRVTHSWNHLQESLGQLFSSVLDVSYNVAASIWYEFPDDRLQRKLLMAAIDGTPESQWASRLPNNPSAYDDLKWLMNEANNLATKRNDAIHAPCIIACDAKMYPSYFFGNRRAVSLAKKVKNNSVLEQFKWYELSVLTLTEFSRRTHSSLISDKIPWPDRPLMPTLGQRDPHRQGRKAPKPK